MKTTASLFAAALAAASTAVPAVELQPSADGRAMEAVIGHHAPTRVRVEGERITDVLGSIASSNQCGGRPAEAPGGALASLPTPSSTNGKGELTLICDPAKGEVYLQPVAKPAKPIVVLIVTAHATHRLLLRVADVPAGTIVIHDAAASGSDDSPGKAVLPPRSAAHVRRLKAMLQALVRGEQPPGTQLNAVPMPVPLWLETAFRRERQLSGAGMVGETYRLRNISAMPMVLAEQEFDRIGERVLAVAIEQTVLQPGEETAIHVIRGGRN